MRRFIPLIAVLFLPFSTTANAATISFLTDPFAADLIAGQIAQSGPGFFIYVNSGLNLPRPVYSTDLSDNTADLNILAHFTDLSDQPDVLPAFTEENFDFMQVPEPATLLLMTTGGAFWASRRLRSRRTRV